MPSSILPMTASLLWLLAGRPVDALARSIHSRGEAFSLLFWPVRRARAVGPARPAIFHTITLFKSCICHD